MSFAIATPPLRQDESVLLAQLWWPNIDLKEAREVLRLDGNVTTVRLVEFLSNAMLSVNSMLTSWQDAQKVAGIEELSDERLVHLYKRAVLFYAHAELLESYRNYDTTGAGERRATDIDASVDEMRRLSRWAVRDMQGLSRVVVEAL